MSVTTCYFICKHQLQLAVLRLRRDFADDRITLLGGEWGYRSKNSKWNTQDLNRDENIQSRSFIGLPTMTYLHAYIFCSKTYRDTQAHYVLQNTG